ncbi:MAG TPA: mechanosensitive ion channel [Pseudomonadaceae bacterium]|nr:mechanosensitive ion channel [Pseudomonadaceae bacterium]
MAFVDLYLKPWAIGIVMALLIFLVGRMLAGYLTRAVTRILERSHIEPMLVRFLSTVLHTVLLIVVGLAAIDRLGVPVTSLLAIVGAAGLAVALALKDSLANFAAGVMIVVFRPFKIGDFINASGVVGVVDEIGMFATFMHTPDNQRIIVPNSTIINGTITNANALPTRRIDLVISISYEDNIGDARNIITEVVRADQRVLNTPQFGIGVLELTDTSVKLFVQPWVLTEDYGSTRSDLIERIKSSLEANGIRNPQQTVYMHTLDKP